MSATALVPYGTSHLHREDHPLAFEILDALFAHREAAAAKIGYFVSDVGAWVAWERLEQSWLSSTERAAVVIARGVAMAESQGGFGHQLLAHVRDAVEGVTRRQGVTEL